MNGQILLFPAYKSFQRNFFKRGIRTVGLLIVCGIIIALAIYFGLFKFLVYVKKAPMLGPIIGPMIGVLLVSKLLEMLFLALFMMIAFSSIVAAFSVFYLDDEIRLLIASPVNIARIFWSRFALMVVESSWMAVAFFLPVFLSFASAFKAPLWAYVVFPIFLAVYLALPNLLGGLIALTLAAAFPIRQMKKVFQFLSILVLAGMVIFFRFMEPEKLLNPNYFGNVSRYILNLRSPFMEYTPSTWIHQASVALFDGDIVKSFAQMLPLIGICLGGILIMHLLAGVYYRKSWQASLEAVENQVLGLEWLRRFLVWPFRFVSSDFRVVAQKEVTIFLRDPAIFSQIFMMGAIIFVYGFNLTILPLKDLPSLYSGEINDSMVYFNGPFIGFILAAISMRFVYPSISLEGRAFWAVKASPIKPERLLMVKFLLYLIPTLILGFTLCFISNRIFEVTTPMLYWLSFINVTLMGLVITSLAIGLGALYARFDADNPLKIAGSFGGFVFMIMCGLFILNILALEAYPLFRIYFSRFYPLRGSGVWIFIILSFLLLAVCSACWVIYPLSKGKEAIVRYEPE